MSRESRFLFSETQSDKTRHLLLAEAPRLTDKKYRCPKVDRALLGKPNRKTCPALPVLSQQLSSFSPRAAWEGLACCVSDQSWCGLLWITARSLKIQYFALKMPPNSPLRNKEARVRNSHWFQAQQCCSSSHTPHGNWAPLVLQLGLMDWECKYGPSLTAPALRQGCSVHRSVQHAGHKRWDQEGFYSAFPQIIIY